MLLKELPPIEGTVNVRGSMSYACQESWLFPATVRENILFGEPYDSTKYKEVNWNNSKLTNRFLLSTDYKFIPDFLKGRGEYEEGNMRFLYTKIIS